MKTFLNILWHFPFFGFVVAILNAIGGAFWCITIVGLPLGLGLLQFSKFLFWPHGNAMVSKKDLGLLKEEEQSTWWQVLSIIIRIFYFVFGLVNVIYMTLFAFAQFISLVGIPQGLVIMKSLPTIFNPINKVCVPEVIAKQIEKTKDENNLRKYTTQPLINSPIEAGIPAVNYAEGNRPIMQETQKTIPSDATQYMPSSSERYEAYVPQSADLVNDIPKPVFNQQEPAPVFMADTNTNASKKSPVLLISIVAACLFFIVGGAVGYKVWYEPFKQDKEAPRFYTFSNNTFLRSSKLAGTEFNKLETVPYGSELITYEQDAEWTRVKKGKTEGYMATPYLLSKSDFFLMNSIFGDNESRECIETAKCKLALLNYYKKKHIYGKPNEEMPAEYSLSEQSWQVFAKGKNVKPNTISYPKVSNKYSKFTDFAVIIKNMNTGGRRLLLFSFNDDESSNLIYEEDAPVSGDIRNIATSVGSFNGMKINVSYTY